MRANLVRSLCGLFVCAAAAASAAPTMIDIPAATARIGSTEGMADERPVHEVTLTAYRLDRTPVTVAAFARFVAATGHVSEAERFGAGAVFDYDAQRWGLVDGATWRRPQGPAGPPAPRDHPVTQVSWDDARAFCAWAGKRLPTEQEWEHAARLGHPNDPTFAVGDRLIREGQFLANFWQGEFPFHNSNGDGYLYTSPVGMFGRTPIGLTDMAGNVWEWTASWYAPYDESTRAHFTPHERVQRGGSFLCSSTGCQGFRVSARGHATPESTHMHVGFRCAVDAHSRNDRGATNDH